MSLKNGDFPSLGSHTSDGQRTGGIFFKGYDDKLNGVLNSCRFNYNILAADPTTADNKGAISTTNAWPASKYLTLNTNTITFPGNGPEIASTVNLNGNIYRQITSAPYGMTIRFNFSGTTTLDTNVTIYGLDYGQYPVTEARVIPAGTPMSDFTSDIAYKWIQAIRMDNMPGLGISIAVGIDNSYGFPYYIYDAGLIEVIEAGTTIFNPGANLVLGDTTFPRTNTSLDPRGILAVSTGYFNVNCFVFGAQPQGVINQQVSDFGMPSAYADPFTSKYGRAQFSSPLIIT